MESVNKIVVPVSYMGSGSSAITDLLSEFEGYKAPMGSNELMLMHYPNGIFDLEDKLLLANNACRSDEAIRSFEKAMRELYSTRFWWAGNYKKNVSPRFYQYVKEYIDELMQYEINAFWYIQEKPNFRILTQSLLRWFISLVTLGRVVLKRPLRYPTMKLSFVSDKEFYEYTAEFLYKLFFDMGLSENNLIIDQLFTPFDVHRFSRYFQENIECFVIDRDPRDVFLLNKYVWLSADTPIPYPIEVHAFVKYYKSIREMEKIDSTEHIYRIHFEDMVYNYEETIKYIKDILKVPEEQHKEYKKYFNPEQSINNTQLFSTGKYLEEVKVIEENLGEYLYSFPYVRKSCLEKSF